MAVILVLLGLLLRFAHLPEVDTDAEDAASTESNLKKTSVWQFPHLIIGVIAFFFYVGVEVIAGDTIIRYGQSLGIEMSSAKYFTSLTLLSMIVGYLFRDNVYTKIYQTGYSFENLRNSWCDSLHLQQLLLLLILLLQYHLLILLLFHH